MFLKVRQTLLLYINFSPLFASKLGSKNSWVILLLNKNYLQTVHVTHHSVIRVFTLFLLHSFVILSTFRTLYVQISPLSHLPLFLFSYLSCSPLFLPHFSLISFHYLSLSVLFFCTIPSSFSFHNIIHVYIQPLLLQFSYLYLHRSWCSFEECCQERNTK